MSLATGWKYTQEQYDRILWVVNLRIACHPISEEGSWLKITEIALTLQRPYFVSDFGFCCQNSNLITDIYDYVLGSSTIVPLPSVQHQVLLEISTSSALAARSLPERTSWIVKSCSMKAFMASYPSAFQSAGFPAYHAVASGWSLKCIIFENCPLHPAMPVWYASNSSTKMFEDKDRNSTIRGVLGLRFQIISSHNQITSTSRRVSRNPPTCCFISPCTALSAACNSCWSTVALKRSWRQGHHGVLLLRVLSLGTIYI